MTTRIPNWGAQTSGGASERAASEAGISDRGKGAVGQEYATARPVATADVIDAAVEEVIRDQHIAPDVAMHLRKLMSVDMKSGAASAYFSSMAAAGAVRAAQRGARRQLVLSYVLTDEQMALLSEYAPEYKLQYRSRDVHDHPLAASSRLIDRDLIYSRLPLSGRIIDVGSDVVSHVASGLLGVKVHACAPLADPKDPSRAVHVNMRVRRLMQTTDRQAVRDSADMFLKRSAGAVCDRPTQACTEKGDYITSVHVYDIPMSDWPAIIERHGAKLVEGCMLFSQEMFTRTSGVMEAAGARYEVDPVAGEFRMGFVGSPSWWYCHRWVDYLKYGVDQVLVGTKSMYSYKIVERRGDTVFFRILPMARLRGALPAQVYALPGVPMVDVSGFEVAKPDRPLSGKRRMYTWPKPLWEDMLMHASVMIERGALDCERMFNYYRTVAPRQTINAVCVAGGHTVAIDELVPLVVHSVLAAAVTVMKEQAEVSAHIDSAMRERARVIESTIFKVLAAFGAALKSIFGAVFYPVELLGRLTNAASERALRRRIVDWEPQVRVRDISAKLLLASPSYAPEMSDIVVDELEMLYKDDAPFDHFAAALKDPELAKALVTGLYDVLPASVLRDLEDVAGPGALTVEVDSAGNLASASSAGDSLPSYRTSAPVVSGAPNLRGMAIEEAIHQCEFEMASVQASMQKTWNELMPSGRPSVQGMLAREEEYRFPMFWWVENGILSHAVTAPNAGLEKFEHSAVFTESRDPDTGSCLRPVYEEDYLGVSQGEEVRRTYYKLSDSTYTGWALTSASVLVYNGPEIVASLRLALTKPLDFYTKLVKGPPGCGKTYQICQVVRADDVVFAPVKKVCLDTKNAIAAKSGEFSVMATDRVRTLDSFLVNYSTSSRVRNITAPRLLADEAFMAHSGRWYAAAALLGVSEIWFYGDSTQIPPVVRAGASKTFLNVRDVDEEVNLWVDYRNPASAVAAWGSLYDWKVRAASQEEGSLTQVASASALPWREGEVMLGFYQVDKREMAKLYASRSVKPRYSTVHEVQGETLKSVRLHRFDMRRRADGVALFDQPAYVLVAMSRHTHHFSYVSPDLGDLVSQWVKRGQNPRRVEAAKHVESAGQSIEML